MPVASVNTKGHGMMFAVWAATRGHTDLSDLLLPLESMVMSGPGLPLGAMSGLV